MEETLIDEALLVLGLVLYLVAIVPMYMASSHSNEEDLAEAYRHLCGGNYRYRYHRAVKRAVGTFWSARRPTSTRPRDL